MTLVLSAIASLERLMSCIACSSSLISAEAIYTFDVNSVYTEIFSHWFKEVSRAPHPPVESQKTRLMFLLGCRSESVAPGCHPRSSKGKMREDC